MSVIVTLKINQTKKIDVSDLNLWAKEQKMFFGVPNEAYVLEPYEGDKKIQNILFVFYTKKSIGRGFSIMIVDSGVEITLNFPATRTDINIFYSFILYLCQKFHIDSFDQDGELVKIEQIVMIKNDLICFNMNVLQENVKEGLTIFGAIYPIVLDKVFIKKIKSLSFDQAYLYYEEYLDQIQKQDLYFAKPLLYKISGDIVARYVLTEDVPSIFPTETYLPFGYDQNLLSSIKEWSVLLVKKEENSLEVACEIPYEDFKHLFSIHRCLSFDAKHILFTLDQKAFHLVRLNKIEKIKQDLEHWLEDPRELGQKPFTVVYCTSFKDKDVGECFIFKYKKNLLSKWLLGIGSDAGVFSQMQEYKKEMAIKDATLLLDTLKDFWKKSAKKERKKDA